MRLNPFAFPSDTTFRFVLFIVAIVGVSLFAFEWLSPTGSCSRIRRPSAGRSWPAGCRWTISPPTPSLAANNACLAIVNAPLLRGVVIGVAALLWAGGAIAYGIAFARVRRRYRSVSRDDSPELADAFASLADRARGRPVGCTALAAG